MTNALAIYEQMNALQSAAQALHASGFFGDVKTQAQAMAKVMAGAEIGLPPFASMSGIHIVQGKPVLGANLIATLVKNDPRYDYRVKRSDNEVCILTWCENGKPVGESAFSPDADTRRRIRLALEQRDGRIEKRRDKAQAAAAKNKSIHKPML